MFKLISCWAGLVIAGSGFCLMMLFIAVEQIDKATGGAFLIEMEEAFVDMSEALPVVPWQPHPRRP